MRREINDGPKSEELSVHGAGRGLLIAEGEASLGGDWPKGLAEACSSALRATSAKPEPSLAAISCFPGR